MHVCQAARRTQISSGALESRGAEEGSRWVKVGRRVPGLLDCSRGASKAMWTSMRTCIGDGFLTDTESRRPVYEQFFREQTDRCT